MERHRRLILFLVPVLFIIALQVKGHRSSSRGEPVAFLPSTTSSHVIVRLTGAVPVPGIYSFPGEATVSDVIKLTGLSGLISGPVPAVSLASGDVLLLADDPTGRSSSVSRMPTKETMLLGIPLQVDLMATEDWQCLPGIGPILAQRIVDERQKNGDFGTSVGLLRVPGIGPKRYEALKRFF